ncbi:hypothetical protein [uncultured Methylobacterium sp.]|uniref:hypothetical protein n=1 Tax=uncultured Methylobacterium sp. TaxID=157278 RepID=UPI0035CAA8F0
MGGRVGYGGRSAHAGPRRGGAGIVAAPVVAGAVLAGLWAGAALASQGPGVSEGTAEPITRATAAAMALFPPVAVAVFALAKLLLRDGR